MDVELENYTSLSSYLHGIDDHNPFLDSLYTKLSGRSIVSRSRQVYRFRDYISTDSSTADGKSESNAQSQSGGDLTHTVVAGDTLSGLAKQYYGDEPLWPVIFDKNQSAIGPNPNQIKVGQPLIIPDRATLTPKQVSDAQRTHRLWLRVRPIKISPLR